MALIIANTIRRKEFGKHIPDDDRDVIVRSAKADLATPIKGEGLPTGTRLLKAYATSPKGARRIVFLMEVEEGDLFLLFIAIKRIRSEQMLPLKTRSLNPNS